MTDYPPVLAIVGSRNYPDKDAVLEYVRALPTNLVVVTGGKGNVDRAVENWAPTVGITTIVFAPVRVPPNMEHRIVRRTVSGRRDFRGLYRTDFDQHPLPKIYPHFAAAAHARNDMIIRYCVENEGGVTVFIDRSQRTPGSESMIEKATKAGVLFEVRELEGTKA